MSQNTFELLAPISGVVVPIEKVPDPVFSQTVVGNGIAVDPTTSKLVAPCAGRVSYIHPGRHALTLTSTNGVQILIHIGLDTVHLKGEGFTPRVQVDDNVTPGQVLVEFDSDLIARRAKSLITVMVVTEPVNVEMQMTAAPMVEAGRDAMLHLNLKSQKVAPSPETLRKLTFSPVIESESIEVPLHTGLHARPAAILANQAKSFQAEIWLKKGERQANAKSVTSLLSLEIGYRDRVTLTAQGADAASAIRTLTRILTSMKEAEETAPKPAALTPSRTSTDGQTLVGLGISPGLAVGRIHQVRPPQFETVENSLLDPDEESAYLQKALRAAEAELQKLSGAGHAASTAIFNAHRELLQDPEILQSVAERIQSGKTAAFAWQNVLNAHADRLAGLNNELLSQRAGDLRDIGRRVLRLLLNSETHVIQAQPIQTSFKETILVAENLTPSDTMQIDRDRVFGFCTTAGGATSHVAILARSLGIPAVAGVELRSLEIAEGTEVILDGDRGEIRLNPSEAEVIAVRKEQARQAEIRKAALAVADRPAITRDGQRVEVFANIGSVEEAKTAVRMGADGVGLLRTEFLFLERSSAPSEDEQLAIYQEIADALGERPLTIRTLDVGGDKPLVYMPLPPEENPFLGVRGIRLSFRFEEQLREQLRAILRVRSQGPVHVMFPMIATLAEFQRAKNIYEEERSKLNAPSLKVGIMMEVPSVALTAEAFAREVDFFSVGTNDLTQYTMAMDRGHSELAAQVDSLHPSVFKLIEMTVVAAHRHGKWVGVCGGLASESRAIPTLLGLGVDELSASVLSVPQVKSQIRGLSMLEGRANAQFDLNDESAGSNNEGKGQKYDSQNVILVSPENR